MRAAAVILPAVLATVLAPSFRPVLAQAGSPAAVVDSFFKATEQQRWRDAARLMDLEAFGELRDQAVRFMRWPKNVPRLTPEDLMKHDPKMPREVAEYEVARSNEAVARYDGVPQEYANVPNVDSLAVLPVEEAAARWLQGRDPRYQMRRSLEAVRSRCALPDSIVSRVLSQTTSTTAQVIGTVLDDSIAYVLYTENPVRQGDADSAGVHSHRRRTAPRASWVMPPPVLTLRHIGSRWRIAPGEPFGGWSGYMSVSDCSSSSSGESSPPRSP